MRFRNVIIGTSGAVAVACAFIYVGYFAGGIGLRNELPKLPPAAPGATSSMPPAAAADQAAIGDDQSAPNRPPDRIMDVRMERQLTTFIPKNKRVGIMVLSGDPERDKFADQIDAFLKSQGYAVLSPHMSFQVGKGGKVPTGTALMPDQDDPDLMIIQVGANMR